VAQNSDNAANRRNRGYPIFVMDADGGNVRFIANTKGRGTTPRWSPDGRKIYAHIVARTSGGFGVLRLTAD